MKTIPITDPKQIRDIICKCPYCMVGVTDEQGNPYVFPMNFCLEERDGRFIIYLHSGPDGYKVRLATQKPQLCITFCEGHELVYMHQQVGCSYSMKSRSVICRGSVSFIEDMDEKRRILDLLMKQHTDYPCRYADAAVRNVKLWAVEVAQISCRSFGLRPSEVQLQTKDRE